MCRAAAPQERSDSNGPEQASFKSIFRRPPTSMCALTKTSVAADIYDKPCHRSVSVYFGLLLLRFLLFLHRRPLWVAHTPCASHVESQLARAFWGGTVRLSLLQFNSCLQAL